MLATASLAIQWAALALGAAPSAQLLFTLGRTTNANVVEYSARLDGKRLAGSHPFDVHWRMLASDGHVEGLNFFEHSFVYGLSSREVGPDSYELRLVSCPDRRIVVRRTGERYEADTNIGGVLSKLTRVFVRASDSALGPKVTAVELYGESLRDGSPTFERLIPKPAVESASRYNLP